MSSELIDREEVVEELRDDRSTLLKWYELVTSSFRVRFY